MLGRNASQFSKYSDGKILGKVVVNIIENRHQLLAFVGAPVGALGNGLPVKFQKVVVHQTGTGVIPEYFVGFLCYKHFIE